MSLEWKHCQLLQSKTLGDYKFTETAYLPQTRLAFHSHEFVYFCFVVMGVFTESYGKHKQIYKRSNLVFHPLEEFHSNYFHTKSRCFNIQFSLQNFENKILGKESLTDTYVFRGENINYLTSKLYWEFYSMDEFSHLTIEGLMLEIMAETFRHSTEKPFTDLPKWLLQIKEMLDDKYGQNQTIDLLANSVNVHPTHLIGEFKKHFQTAIGNYVRRKRIEQSTKRLIETKTPISEIAIESGFFDQSHFTRIFKKVTGMTPKTYRNIFSKR
ncbi:MAG: AraC family transcriptional regulator [Pyrinomonadaceae bacterium]